jgi:hypothetical protein
MIPVFTHHVIPLLPIAGRQGDTGAKEITAAKEAMRGTERINGALKSACRVETVLVHQDLDLLSTTTGKGKAHSVIWSAIKSATNLRWILLTSRPETVTSALPSDWIGKGYPNVCIGAVIDDPARLAEARKHLTGVPCRCRLLLFTTPPSASDLEQALDGIHWVVNVTDNGDQDHLTHLRSVCRSASVAFLSLPRDLPPPDCAGEVDPDDQLGVPVSPEHPFGSDIQLRRPTLPGLRKNNPEALSWDIKTAAPVSPSHAAETAELATTVSPDTPAIPEKDSREAPLLTSKSEADDMTTFELLPTVSDDGCQEISDRDRSDFVRLDKTVRRGAAAFRECGLALAEIHSRKLWKAGTHTTWEFYVREVLGMSKPYAHRLVTAARIATHLAESLPIGNDLPPVLPLSESQIRPLCRLKSPEQWTSAWAVGTERADGQPTQELLRNVVAEMMAEDPARAAPRPTRKQKLSETIRLIREASAAPDRRDRVEALLRELEMLLKLT